MLNTDTVQGTHLVRLGFNPSNGGLLIDSTATISFTMVPIDPEDQNYVGCWIFQGDDGLLYPAVGTSDGEILVDM